MDIYGNEVYNIRKVLEYGVLIAGTMGILGLIDTVRKWIIGV